MIEFRIESRHAGLRLDKILLTEFDITFSMVQKFIRKKNIKVNDKKVPHDYKCSAGDLIRIFANIENRTKSQKIQSFVSDQKLKYLKMFEKMIVFENDNFVAINKPGGLAVQSGSKISLCIDDMIRAYNSDYRLVHRLDKDTSGLLLIAKNIDSARKITDMFRVGKIRKKYIAVLSRGIEKKSGIIKNFIKKTVISKEEKMVVCNKNDDGAVYAETVYEVIGICKNGLPYVALYPKTGRKHQLRVHCAEVLNAPILGDIKYGKSSMSPNIKHMYLHAEKLSVPNNLDMYAAFPKYIDDII